MATDLDRISISSNPSISKEIESISFSSNNVNSEILVKIFNSGFESMFTKDYGCS